MPKKAAPAVPAAVDETDYTKYVDKGATDLQARFAEWIVAKTEYNPAGARSKAEAFAEGVRLATALRMPFQRSPENQEVLEAAREAQDTAKPAAKKAAPKAAPAKATKAAPVAKATKAAAPAKKATKKAAPASEPEPDEDMETVSLGEEEQEAAQPRTRKPAKRARAGAAEAPF